MPTNAAQLYEEDFVRWSQEQSSALREAAKLGTNLPLDWQNLAEEIESLGRSQRHELRSRLMVILEHLLKLEHSPTVDPRRGWTETIERERVFIEDLLQDSPSLRGEIDAMIARAAPRAVRLAALSLAKHGETAPLAVPDYRADRVLGDWLPADPPISTDRERVVAHRERLPAAAP
ncbi:MAG TPA: DUF29 domain-containing protein [Stellaceae bacterium]|jgi:hypothetical protein